MRGTDGMLKKGLRLLEAMGGHPDGVGVSQAAKDAALPVSTTYRLLNDLVASGFASFDPETRRYYLGLKVFELSSRVSLTKGLSEVALPVMISTPRDSRGRATHTSTTRTATPTSPLRWKSKAESGRSTWR